jgi:hypothetical protein
MRRRPLLPLTAIAALMLSAAAAQAQDAPPAAAAPAHRSYSSDEMSHFARATVELQNLGSQDPAQMTRAIQGAGMSVQDYNRMGDAMRADPKLAASLNPYLDSANTERTARIYAERSRTPSFAGQARRASSRHAVASHKATPHKASSHKTTSRHSRSSAHKTSHTGSTRHAHATKASHKHTTSTAHHTAKKKTAAHKSSTATHKTARRHKH